LVGFLLFLFLFLSLLSFDTFHSGYNTFHSGFESVTIANGGVLPNIHQNLLPKKAGKGKGDIGSASQEF